MAGSCGERGPRFQEMTPAMADTIKAGSIWVMDGAHLPPSLLLQSPSDSNGWAAVQDDGPTFEKAVQKAGWTLFFMAGEIEATVLGFNKEKALRAAFRRLIANVTSQHCNCIEIRQIVPGRSLRECFRACAASTEGRLFFGERGGLRPGRSSPNRSI